MSARRDLLRDDLEATGPTKLSDVEAAQREILTMNVWQTTVKLFWAALVSKCFNQGLTAIGLFF